MGSALRSRGDILALEASMIGMDPGFEEGLEHFFGHQTYARQMTLSKGSLIVGKLHRFSCVNILSKGAVRVEGEFESDTYTAPHTWVSRAGTKRAIVAIEDCIWTTIHGNPTNTQDMSELENMLIAESYEALEII